jgi:Ca-activated chloride channel family protein
MRRTGSRALLATLVALCSPAAAAEHATPEPSPQRVLADLKATGAVWMSNGPRDAVDGGEDRTAAPYLYVAGADPTRERLPLAETSADVRIAGVIAQVRVHQVFVNGGAKPIEAVYVFPASTRAAVHAMRMTIGSRTIEARIDRRAEARAAYEAARQEGRRASLLEQERPNVFTMNVANLMPGDRVAVDLDYSELLVPEHATYELVYPAVVGPRYAGGADPRKDGWMANPHLPAGEAAPYAWDVRVHLETGIAIKELTSPSHKVRVSSLAPGRADVRLDEANGGDRDFVLRYRLAGDRIEAGALLWEETTGVAGAPPEKYFALLLEPPARPRAAEIPPREYVFLLDVSGSMHGFPLDTAKALMRNLLGQLRPTDLVNVALFSGANYVWQPRGSVPASAENVREAIDLIERQTGGGGTELMGGLEACYRIPRRDERFSRTVVVVTDGYVGVEAQAFRFVRERLGEANLFAFGIGSSVNRALIEGLARAGMGEPFVVLKPEKAADEAARLREMIERPVLTRVRVEARGFEAYDVAPEHVPDLLAERPLVLFGKYRGAANGALEISGLGGAGKFARTIAISSADVRPENAPVRELWARKWVDILADEHALRADERLREAITTLGLRHHLLTAFTSFVAVDSQIVNRGGAGETVRQPLPMPEGVSNLAVAQAAAAPAAAASSGLGAGLRMRSFGGAGVAREPAPMLAKKAMAPAKEEAKPDAARADDGAAAQDRADSRATLVVQTIARQGVGDVAALLKSVRAKLDGVAGCAGAGTWTLRVTVDGHGKVIAVALVAGDAGRGGCLVKALAGLSSATTAAGTTGTVDLRVVVPAR